MATRSSGGSIADGTAREAAGSCELYMAGGRETLSCDLSEESRKVMTSSSQSKLAWHLITCEYPPQIGGVSDYTFLMARELARAGEEVHVWCGAASGDYPESPGVSVHRELRRFSP